MVRRPYCWAAATCTASSASGSVGVQFCCWAGLVHRSTKFELCCGIHHHTNSEMVLTPSALSRWTSSALCWGSTFGMAMPATLLSVPSGTVVVPGGGVGPWPGGLAAAEACGPAVGAAEPTPGIATDATAAPTRAATESPHVRRSFVALICPLRSTPADPLPPAADAEGPRGSTPGPSFRPTPFSYVGVTVSV